MLPWTQETQVCFCSCLHHYHTLWNQKWTPTFKCFVLSYQL
jgi:hypothetical protein